MEETFYDSLEEDSDSSPPNESLKLERNTIKDISEIIPLYSGETPKNLLANTNQCPSKRNKKTNPVPSVKKNKSYLSIYHAKVKNPEESNSSKTDTNIGVCDDESLKSDCDHQQQCDKVYSESDSERFMEMEVNNKRKSLSDMKSKIFEDKWTKNIKMPVLHKKIELEKFGPEEKLKTWRKRQNYGQKVSLRNRIKMIEEKQLKDLKNY